jgi:hypothetical protein
MDEEMIMGIVLLAVFFCFDDFGEIHYIRSSRNTFEHFRDDWYSEGRILPEGVNRILKKNSPGFDNVRHK